MPRDKVEVPLEALDAIAGQEVSTGEYYCRAMYVNDTRMAGGKTVRDLLFYLDDPRDRKVSYKIKHALWEKRAEKIGDPMKKEFEGKEVLLTMRPDKLYAEQYEKKTGEPVVEIIIPSTEHVFVRPNCHPKISLQSGVGLPGSNEDDLT